jgi:hypothetical protein
MTHDKKNFALPCPEISPGPEPKCEDPNGAAELPNFTSVANFLNVAGKKGFYEAFVLRAKTKGIIVKYWEKVHLKDANGVEYTEKTTKDFVLLPGDKHDFITERNLLVWEELPRKTLRSLQALRSKKFKRTFTAQSQTPTL